MNNVIEISNLTKRYSNFLLDGISFTVPNGFVCGFIGQNGSGKTTTLKLMLGMIMRDGGDITLLGKPVDDVSVKEELGVLFEQPYYQEDWTPLDVGKAMRSFYRQWDDSLYRDYLDRFSLNQKQKFKHMSRGMKMKLGTAVALSHNAKVLLFDEPTSGLDPVARDEMLDILRDYMTKEDRSIFFSTHITSDLEKLADYITYLHKGTLIFSGPKDELTDQYCLVRGGSEDLSPEKRRCILGLREYQGGFEGMIDIKDIGGFPRGVVTEPVTLEDIMVHISKGGQKND